MLLRKGLINLLLFCLGVSTPLFADEPLVIVHAPEYKPYYYSVEDSRGQLQGKGFLLDLIRGAAAEAEMDVSFQVVDSWNRAVNLVRLSRADAMFPIFKTEERLNFMRFPPEAVLAYEVNVLVSRKADNLQFNGNFRVHRRRVFGVIANYSYGRIFDNAFVRRQTVYSEEELLQTLHGEDRFDFIVGNRDVLKYLARERGILDDLAFHDYQLSNDPLYLAFAREGVSSEAAHRLARAIKDYKETPEYQELLARFKEGKL